MNKLVFIVDDEEHITTLLSYWVKDKWKYDIQIFSSGEEVLKKLYLKPDLVLLDIMMPGINGVETLKRIKQFDQNIPVIILSAQGSIEVAVESLRYGAFDYFPKPIDNQRLEPAIKNAINAYELVKEVDQLKELVKREYSFDNIVSADIRMQDVFKLISKVLDNDITVLINGESGVGKELVARAIHYNGKRKDKPFVVVNCASIPRELLESELFGHEKGSFTGAHQRKLGKFEVANGGTLFLDEVGDLEMSLQAKILRVIQERTFERVGGNELIRSDVRILSATNRDLRAEVDKKSFREDLYYRLSSFPIYVPPLRQRKGDILVLADHFLKIFNIKLNRNIKGFSKKVLKLMYNYEWFGNIREMENTIERCIIVAEKDFIEVDDLPAHIRSGETSGNIEITENLFNDENIIPFEKLKEESIRHALRVTKGNIVEAAKKLQLGRATIYRLMEKYNIESKNLVEN
ncbi:MAG: sigma-54-dependent transcriptional regulator [Syntrophothermus sp.]|nr:sigma-54 dependent transcriptional regulator [Ignavibacteriaceae bacterium]